MLELIAVDGFRSLKNFKLEIRPGLNVLVGPNGAGKTNIILFFDFVRKLIFENVSDAVGETGGVASIFSKEGKERFKNEISASLSGKIKSIDGYYSYSYRFKIEFSKEEQDVSFTNQSLIVSKLSENEILESNYLESTFSARGHEAGHVTNNFSKKYKNTSKWTTEIIDDFSKRGHFRKNSITALLSATDPVIQEVNSDFSGRFVLNVIPSHAKKQEDATRKPGISSDGTGISATLFAIKRKKTIHDNGHYLFRTARTKTPIWEDVIDVIRIAVPSIHSIDVLNDPFDNLLRCQITVGNDEQKSVVPLSALSDGTVKWISIILRLATSKDSLLLEEPENYLHPLMQKEIVRLLREQVSDAGFMIISTHSETLLNAVHPDELIIVNYENNSTRANRVVNSNDVEDEINSTGFGLGYYYLANAVEAE